MVILTKSASKEHVRNVMVMAMTLRHVHLGGDFIKILPLKETPTPSITLAHEMGSNTLQPAISKATIMIPSISDANRVVNENHQSIDNDQFRANVFNVPQNMDTSRSSSINADNGNNNELVTRYGRVSRPVQRLGI